MGIEALNRNSDRKNIALPITSNTFTNTTFFKWVRCTINLYLIHLYQHFIGNIWNEGKSFETRIDWFLSLFWANSSNIGQYSQFPRREKTQSFTILPEEDKYWRRAICASFPPCNLGQCMQHLAIASRERISADNYSNRLHCPCISSSQKGAFPPVCIWDNTVGSHCNWRWETTRPTLHIRGMGPTRFLYTNTTMKISEKYSANFCFCNFPGGQSYFG